jgi:pimeloyl-ACP methyl ester carboxylesterase
VRIFDGSRHRAADGDPPSRLGAQAGVPLRGIQGEYQEIRSLMSQFAPDMPMLGRNRQAYVHAAKSPEGWPALVEKTRVLLCESYDWSAQVARLSMPVLIVAGDSDIFPVAHALEMFKLLGGDTSATAMGGSGRARLAVLPGTNHFEFMQRTDLLVPILSTFLE